MKKPLFRVPGPEKLQAEHTPEAIRQRLARTPRHSYLGDAVLGAIDGCVTTFAVISGAMGGGFSAEVASVLGAANLMADGFSMAISNYHSASSQRELVECARAAEDYHIQHIPEGEREELRQIFARKGLEGEVLEQIVDTVAKDRQRWIDTMLTEELGLQIETPPPWRAGLVTFIAFLGVGFLPLLPFWIPDLPPRLLFPASVMLTGVAFFGIGWVKGLVVQAPPWRAGWTTLWTGGTAALLAYMVARLFS